MWDAQFLMRAVPAMGLPNAEPLRRRMRVRFGAVWMLTAKAVGLATMVNRIFDSLRIVTAEKLQLIRPR